MKVLGRLAIMYLAHPTRIWKSGGSGKIVEFARKKGFAPVNPFTCGDFQDFEDGAVGREGTLQWTLHLQRGCYWSGYFGISEGVMREIEDRLKWDSENRMRIFYEDDAGVLFDPQWNEEYARLSKKFGDLLAELRGRHRLIAFVGPSATGKTYWIERLIRQYRKKLERVKNTTTRPPRDESDRKYYNRATKDEFLAYAESREFLEYDQYLGHYYGSSLAEMRRVLRSSNGIFAITPKGAQELYRCRHEMNVELVLLRPVNESVLLKNFGRRGEQDKKKIEESIQQAKNFILPASVNHHVLELTGTRADEEQVFNLISSLLK